MKANGLNSILEILSFACVMSQYDPFILEEYANPLIEQAKATLIAQNLNQTGTVIQLIQSDKNSVDTIFINFLQLWISILNDSKNLSKIHLAYLHALNTIKTIYLSSSKKILIDQN